MGRKSKVPLVLQLIQKLFPILESVLPALAHRFFVYIFFTPMRYRATEKEVEAASFARKFSEVIAGRKIQGYSWGDDARPAVLVVHGWAGRATQFRKFIEPLNTAGFRVIGFDGPAHGLSEGRKTDLNEFQLAIQHLCDTFDVKGIITHSFGGGATLYAITKGLPPRPVVNIASPTIADEIINTYLRAINGSAPTGEFFKKYVLKRTGKSFESFTALGFIDQVEPNLDLLLIHDLDDKDVIIEHPRALIKRFPKAQLVETNGLGHTRILKDQQVINYAVTFIAERSSGGRNSEQMVKSSYTL
jgi:pimeloyl-ACP methyl ester carboxylesterase